MPRDITKENLILGMHTTGESTIQSCGRNLWTAVVVGRRFKWKCSDDWVSDNTVTPGLLLHQTSRWCNHWRNGRNINNMSSSQKLAWIYR